MNEVKNLPASIRQRLINQARQTNRPYIDVVALNWKTNDILLGGCKWGMDRIDRQVVSELIQQKTPLVLKDLPDSGEGWQVHYAVFGRTGITPAAREEIEKYSGYLVDLQALDQVLGWL